MIFVMGGVQIFLFSWVFGLKRGLREAEEGAEMRIPRLFGFVMKYVSPFYVAVVFIGFCVQTLPGYIPQIQSDVVVQYALGLIALVAIVLVLVTRIGEKRWLGEGRDIDGRFGPEDLASATSRRAK
jgi:hypothetical protein